MRPPTSSACRTRTRATRTCSVACRSAPCTPTGTKIAEHGGDNPGDRDVPLLVYAPGTVHHSIDDSWVETTQVAPTILHLLGLDPNALKAVQEEGTKVLPGIG